MREEWLNVVAVMIMDLDSLQTPNISSDRKFRVSCDIPSRGAFASKQRVGECWHEVCSSDHVNEIYISPALNDPLQAFAVLMHELCHVVTGLDAGHGKGFAKVAHAIGLTGKMREATRSEETAAWAVGRIALLGDYPPRGTDREGGPHQEETGGALIEGLLPRMRLYVSHHPPPCGKGFAGLSGLRQTNGTGWLKSKRAGGGKFPPRSNRRKPLGGFRYLLCGEPPATPPETKNRQGGGAPRAPVMAGSPGWAKAARPSAR